MPMSALRQHFATTSQLTCFMFCHQGTWLNSIIIYRPLFQLSERITRCNRRIFPFDRVHVKALVLVSNSRHSTECFFSFLSNSSILLHSIPFSILPIGCPVLRSYSISIHHIWNILSILLPSFAQSLVIYSRRISIYPLTRI